MQVEPMVYHGSLNFRVGTDDVIEGLEVENCGYRALRWVTRSAYSNTTGKLGWTHSARELESIVSPVPLIFCKAKVSFLQNKVSILIFLLQTITLDYLLLKWLYTGWLMGQIRVLRDKRTLYNLSEGLKKSLSKHAGNVYIWYKVLKGFSILRIIRNINMNFSIFNIFSSCIINWDHKSDVTL